jgi:hypothetical protein
MIMAMANKLETLNQRKSELARELADLAGAKPETDNSALGDLEKALMTELDSVEKQIRQIQAYLEQCEVQDKPAE